MNIKYTHTLFKNRKVGLYKNMVSKEIRNMYCTAATNLADAKLALGDAIAQDLTFGGNHISELLEETKAVTNAIGCVMGLLVRNGERIEPVDGQDGFVSMILNGRKLICSIEQLSGKIVNNTEISNEIPCPDNNQKEENVPQASILNNEVHNLPKQNELDDNKKENNLSETDDVVIPKEEQFTENINSKVDNIVDEFMETANETVSEINGASLFANDEIPHEPAFIAENSESKLEKPATEEKQGARFVMPTVNETTVSAISLGDIFQDEKSKSIDEFVFETYRIMVSHMGIGKGEDMTLMIAPLKISKYADANTPIVVYVYYKGRSYIRSSYDALDDGKNIVTMQIGDYELLFRGSFDGNGVFQSMISTTGISANQGDRITVIDKTSHCPVGKQVKNGHLKFRYTAWENGSNVQGTMEVFPVSEDEDEYVAIAVHGEWRDSHYISRKSGGLPEVRLKTEQGMPSALICVRNGNLVEADIVMR